MPRAYNLLRPDNGGPIYRRESFTRGLKAAGYDVVEGIPPGRIEPGDLLLIWSRYGKNHDLACRFEATDGCAVLVAENGFVGVRGQSPHSMAERDPYSLNRGAHNDSTVVREGPEDRWTPLCVKVAPWRADGGHVLVCPARSFGTPGRFMPIGWEDDVKRRLQGLTTREIRIRPHPGNRPPRKPLADDLAGAWATVIWSSSAGVHSLIAGVPTFVEGPFWIMKECGAGPIADIERPAMSDRVPALRRLAWAQRFLFEIEDGDAFRDLLAA